jgi:cell fate regulator YaaT (PSP1 superfamily)
MPKSLVQLYSWENPRLCGGEIEIEQGDLVIVETEFGNDIGKIITADLETKDEVQGSVMRKATNRDIEANKKNEERKEEILKITHEEIKRLEMAMKLVDARLALDGGNVVIFFTADGRVDFRDLVKNLSRILHRSVRMQQIGSRDEARKLGGCGVCGRELCCEKFPGNLPSITTDMARIQQISHRGSERISGLCGRLMCCLAYEASQYQELLVGMPEVGSFVKTKVASGKVIEVNALREQVTLILEDGKYATVNKKDLK